MTHMQNRNNHLYDEIFPGYYYQGNFFVSIKLAMKHIWNIDFGGRKKLRETSQQVTFRHTNGRV